MKAKKSETGCPVSPFLPFGMRRKARKELVDENLKIYRLALLVGQKQPGFGEIVNFSFGKEKRVDGPGKCVYSSFVTEL